MVANPYITQVFEFRPYARLLDLNAGGTHCQRDS